MTQLARTGLNQRGTYCSAQTQRRSEREFLGLHYSHQQGRHDENGQYVVYIGNHLLHKTFLIHFHCSDIGYGRNMFPQYVGIFFRYFNTSEPRRKSRKNCNLHGNISISSSGRTWCYQCSSFGYYCLKLDYHLDYTRT